MKEILEAIIRDPLLEAKWLNTLSLLEYIGSRKISKTFAKYHPPLHVLEHQADEARHAYAFRRLSVILSDRAEEPGYLCPEAATKYFQTLDHELCEWITKLTLRDQTYHNYLLVSAIVERRAMNLYPLYRKLARNGFVRDELKEIIEEEANHRRFIEENILAVLNRHDVPDFTACDEIESRLFEEFSAELSRVVLGGQPS